MKLFRQYMAIIFNFPPTSNHLHPLQVQNCDSNSRLVVDEERVNNLQHLKLNLLTHFPASTTGFLVQWLKLPALKVGDHRFFFCIQVSKNKMFLLRSFPKIQYCGEPLWPRGSVLRIRPLVLEFRILCLEGSVISLISPSSEGSPGTI